MALAPLLDAIERLPAFVRLYNTMPVPGERRTIGGLPGSADASVLAALARRLTTRFFVVATERVTQAERWRADGGGCRAVQHSRRHLRRLLVRHARAGTRRALGR